MTTEPDFFGIKERIVAILKDDTTNLFSATPTDKTKFRLIQAGAPDLNKPIQGPFPRIFVTNDDDIDTMVRRGSIVSNAPKTTRHEMKFKIIFVVDGKDGPDTEEKIDDFTKLILQKLKEFSDLRNPGGAESTQLADTSFPERITIFNRDLIGSNVQGRVIFFRVITTTGE